MRLGSRNRLSAFLLCLGGGMAWGLSAAESAVPVPMQQQASGNYYVHGTLTGGIGTEMLVDTGSGYVSLSKATFGRVKSQPGTEYLRDIVGTMANGKLLKVPVYRIAELALGAACILTDVEVVVMPNTARDILGLSALRRLEPFTITLSTPALVVSGCGERLPTTAALFQ
jgi:predicted aspartyl protease